MSALYPLLRPLLFRLDAETAHDLTFRMLDAAVRLGLTRGPEPLPGRAVECMGLRFPNPVGLAAGLDKNAAHVDGLASFGFGFLEVGTVTPRAQPGNPRPRLFRLPDARGIINRMGFNNGGVDGLLANAAAVRFRGILGINIGKNFDTPIERAADDYLACLRKVYARADYVTVNISSPNTKNLRSLQEGDALLALLRSLKDEQTKLAATHGRRVPLAVKIAPDLDESQLDAIADVLASTGMDAVIATNTTLSRDGVTGLLHGDEAGGLSGAPVRDKSTAVVRGLAKRLDGRLPIIAAGGVLSGADAREKIDAGATLVQIYSGLIYRGPALVEEAIRALA